MRSGSPLRESEDLHYGFLCGPHHHIFELLHPKKGQGFPLPGQVKVLSVFLKYRRECHNLRGQMWQFSIYKKTVLRRYTFLKQNLTVTLCSFLLYWQDFKFPLSNRMQKDSIIIHS